MPINVYYPTNYIKTLGTGTNKPILVHAMDKDGNRDEMVVKLLESERMDRHANLRELVATLIAQKLKINIPEAAQISINNDFVQTLFGQYEHGRVQKSIGLNFGCKYLEDLQQMSVYDDLKKTQTKDALKIFYFDMMIQNADRTIVGGKPNLFYKNDQLWILDHELAFTFLFPIIGRASTEPWIINESDKNMVENHILYSKLKNNISDFSSLEDILVPLTSEFWRETESDIPIEWMSEDFAKIKDHINSINDNSHSFLKQIITLLS